MELLYKEDWEPTKRRYEAWWNRDNVGRCGLWVTAPRDGAPATPPPKLPDAVAARWTDLDYISARNEYQLSRTYFGGEAFPLWDAGHPGHDSIAAFLGCAVDLQEDTGWISPILTGEELDWRSVKLDERNDYYQQALMAQRRAIAEAKGKALPGFRCALGGCGDSLAWLRGTEPLLMDVLCQPEEVMAAETHLLDLWIEIYETFFALYHEACEGSANWFPLWSPGKFYATHCDFAFNLSPPDFAKVFVPTIAKQCRYLDHSIHHLDGEGNFCHVEALCEVERLGGIQVLPGPGKPGPLSYLPMLKRIQAKGKNLHLGLNAGEVETALGELSACGLFIHTACATEGEARDLIKKCEHWSHDRTVI